MPKIPKKSQPSLPTVPRSTSSVTIIHKSNIKLPNVKAKQTQRVPGLNSVSSGPSIVKDVVPAISDILEEARGSVKSKNFPSHAQSNPSSSSTFAKPSALRMPSPSVGFFTQENAHVSYGDASKRNVGRCFVGNTSSVVKPPRYKQPEDITSRLRKPLSTNCTTVSNLVLPVTRESNRNNLVGPEKECSSKVFTTYSEKSGDANNKNGPDVDCLLAANGAATQPVNSEKNDVARNSMPIVFNDTSLVERRGITAEIEHIENTYSLEAICSSTIEPVEDSFSLKSTCTSTKTTVGGTLSPSCIYSQICSSSDLTCQSKSDRICSPGVDLENSCVGETALAVSLGKGDSCTPALDFLQGFDSCNHQDTECSTAMESASAICPDQVQCCGSARDETPGLVDSISDVNDSLCNAKPVTSEELDADGGMELETNDMLAVNELLHMGCEHSQSYRSTECSPTRPEEERQHVSSVESMEDKMVLDTNKLSAPRCLSHIEKNKAVDRSRSNAILKDHLKNLVPFSEEWLAVMEARGQEVLEQKSGAVQNSPPDKAGPEPSPWSPVKRKAQDVGPFDCTKYPKSVGTSGTA